MGDGVTGSTNAPANQAPNAARSGSSSATDPAAKGKFGEALKQQSIDLKIHGDPDRFKPCTTRETGPDYTKPIPPSHEKEVKPPPIYHTGGMGSLDGAHIGGVKGTF